MEDVCAHACVGACTCVLIRRPEESVRCLLLAPSAVFLSVKASSSSLQSLGNPILWLVEWQPTSPRDPLVSASLGARVTDLHGSVRWVMGSD